MKIEHKIEQKINEELVEKLVTPEVLDAFDKYSISENISWVLENLKTGEPYCKTERALRCLAVVIKGVELGLLENAIELKVEKIMQKLMAKTQVILNDVEQHLMSHTEFNKAIYSINLNKIFDTNDSHLFYLVREAFDKYLAEKQLVACYYKDKVAVYGWHREAFFDNRYAQDDINALCEEAGKMIDVEADLYQKWQTTKGHDVDIYPENENERNQITMCLTLMKKRWHNIRNDEKGPRYISFLSMAGDAYYGN